MSKREAVLSFSIEAIDVLTSLARAVPAGELVCHVLRSILAATLASEGNRELCRALAERCWTVSQTVIELTRDQGVPSKAYAAALVGFSETLKECLAAIESFSKKKPIYKITRGRRVSEVFVALQARLLADVQLLSFGLAVKAKLQMDQVKKAVGDTRALYEAAKADQMATVEFARLEIGEASKRAAASKSEKDQALLALMNAKFAELKTDTDAASKSRSSSSSLLGTSAPAASDASSALGRDLAEISLLDIDFDEQTMRPVHNQPGAFLLNALWCGSLVSVKRLASGSKKDREIFEREAHIMSSLRHPRVASVYGFNFASESCLVIIGEHSSCTLDDLIYGNFDVPVERRVQFCIDVAHALAYAHSRGVLHRAVRAANCIVADDGRAKLSDFALAKAAAVGTIVSATGGDDLRWTAPEAISDSKNVTAKSDVWSLGMLLYEVLVRSAPWGTCSEFNSRVLPKLLTRAAEPVVPLVDGASVPMRARDVMLQCWQWEAASRSSAALIAAELETIKH
jgi:serine/threonine protein kinase